MSTTVSPIRARGEGGMSLLCNTRACWLHAGVPRGIVSGFRALTHSRVSQSRREYMQWERGGGLRESLAIIAGGHLFCYLYLGTGRCFETLCDSRGTTRLDGNCYCLGLTLSVDCLPTVGRLLVVSDCPSDSQQRWEVGGRPCRVWLLTRKWELRSLREQWRTRGARARAAVSPPPETHY